MSAPRLPLALAAARRQLLVDRLRGMPSRLPDWAFERFMRDLSGATK